MTRRSRAAGRHPARETFAWAAIAVAMTVAGCLPTDQQARRADVPEETVARRIPRTAPPAPSDIDPSILRSRSFREAPMLAARVAAGQLPPVSERLPDNPVVVRPIDEIGKYGGTIRRAVVSESEGWSEINKTLNENLLGFARPFGEKIEPDMAESYELRDGGRTAIFRLRRGLRWSDGVPFTVDDILFWYHEVLFESNTLRLGMTTSDWYVAGKPIRMEKLDDLTLKASADRPMGMILVRFCHDQFALPKHYFARYHPRYNPNATYRDFNRRVNAMNLAVEPGVPRMSAWVSVQWNEGQRILFERNPYYFKVDTAGNQLPYADHLSFAVIPDTRVLLLKFTVGEIDLIGRYVTQSSVPTLAAEVTKGRFELFEREPEAGPAIYFNWDAQDLQLREAFRDVRVRRALSCAINRREISRIVYGGNLAPAGFGFSPGSNYHDPSVDTLWSAFDPALARRLLDEAGYRDRDGDGFREFPDGRRFEVAIDFTYENRLSDLMLLISEYWAAVGVKLYPNPGREEIIQARRISGEFQLYAYNTVAGADDPRGSSGQWSMQSPGAPFWYRDAFETRPAWLSDITALMNRALEEPDEAQARALLRRIERTCADDVVAIGLGGVTRPWAANVRIGNVPRKGDFSNAVRGWSRPVYHEQLFIRESDEAAKDGPRDDGRKSGRAPVDTSRASPRIDLALGLRRSTLD